MNRLACLLGCVLSALSLDCRSQAPTALRTVLFGTFSAPVQLVSPPGDDRRIFVVEKTGAIRLHKDGVVLAAPFLDLSSQIVVAYEQGLLGLAFHPAHATNGLFYVNYTQAGSGATVIARYRIQGGTNFDVADPSSAATILTVPQPYANHNGGTLRFGPDGLLYIGMGDGGSSNDPHGNAQNADSLLGKLLRIDVDHPAGGLPYGIPPGNPFVGSVPGRDEVACLGLRNPWQFSFDRSTGDLYVGDVGQDAREEVDFVPAAELLAPITPATVKNFGWRCMEGLQCTGLSGCTCNAPNLTLPIHTFPTSTSYAVIGGFVYRGCAIPDLRGTYFFAEHLGALWSLRVVGGVATGVTSRTVELDPAGGETISGITAFGEDACGELYVLEHGGQVWKIVPVPPEPTTGLAGFGTGTPGCLGLHGMWASCPPTLQNPTWKLTCTNAPPSAFGFAMLAAVADTAGSDPFSIGLRLHVDPASGLYSWLAASDGSGRGSARFAIPNQPQLVGLGVFAQMFWYWPPGTCQPSVLGVSSTPGLSVVFQL